MRHQIWGGFLLVLLLSLCNFHPAVAEESFDFDGDLNLDDDEASGLFRDADDDASPDEETKITTAAPVVETIPYIKPSTSGLEFAETFDGDIFSRWTKCGNEKFTGEWSHAARNVEAIVGDKGLKIMNEARFHGISTKLPTGLKNNKGKSVVVSYEVKFEDSLTCGGAYLKLFDSATLPSKGAKMAEFDNDTPYIVMFGPDRCGATNKVHLIIKQLNPISKQWVEHHLIDPPRVPFGSLTHVYGFHLTPDNKYSVYVDGKVEKTGSMMKDFEPPFTPPTEIDDSSDTKPADWVDEETIADPDAVKPEDWDENAPRMISSPDAVMPEGWLVNEAKTIVDPSAHKPETWDDEEDGGWTAPTIPNPACTSAPGCGEWSAPSIPNPNYKGKWSPPMIPNPEYKGVWSPKKIPNPNYFVSENPHAIGDIDGVGFELWTMQKEILFDNIVVARSVERVQEFIKNSWDKRHEIEAAQEKATAPTAPSSTSDMGIVQKVVTGAMLLVNDHPILAGVVAASAVLLFLMSLAKLFKSKPTERAAEEEQEEEKTSGEELRGEKSSEAPRQRRAKKE